MGQLEADGCARINAISEAEVLREDGSSAHETKNWIAVFAAAGNEPVNNFVCEAYHVE